MTNNLNNRYMLQRHRKELEDSLTFDDIKDKLHSKFVLTSDEVMSIDELDNNTKKVSACLDLLLMATNPVVLDDFIVSLNETKVQVCNDIYKKLTDSNDLKHMKLQEGTEAILRGAIPKIDKSYIPRVQEKDLEQLLSKQELSEIIVIKGYPLVGKTSFVSRVLRQNPALIFDCFQNTVLWLDLGNVTGKNPTSIADCLKRLIGRITKFDQTINLQPEQPLEWYKDVFRSKFHDLCMGGLLILDNIRCKNVVEYFDIGCKMLVIANRKCVINGTSKQLEVNNFTIEETAACFTSVIRLPKHLVIKIHHCLEGHPKLVMVLANYLKERQADKWNSKRWDDWLTRLHSDGDYRRDSHFGVLQIPLEHIANMLLEMLLRNEQNYFKELAIMPEHVNIFPEVLSVYWGRPDLVEVEHIVHRFCKRSLLEQKYEDGRYIYGIRNLFLKCLKSTQDSEFLTNCHRKLLEAYTNKYGEPTMFPNDNYIFNYYGYHLVGAKKPAEKFIVFLNLKFIGAKIKFCGVGAMLQDFRMYETYITKNNSLELTTKLGAYIDFVEKCETNLLKNGLDLVQYALCKADNHQIVFNDALNIARNSNNLYLTWSFKKEPLFTRTLDVHNRFETVLFANDPKLILVGTKTGEIQLWDLDSKLMILKYIGHNKGIKQLKLSPCKKYFLSVSHDMTFKIWKMYVTDTCTKLIVTSEPLSPSLRQRDHHSFFADETCVSAIGDSSHNQEITSATFYKSSNANQSSSVISLVNSPSDGKLLQWTFKEEDPCSLQRKSSLLVASEIDSFDVITAGEQFLFLHSHADNRLYVVNPEVKGEKKYVCIVSLPNSSSNIVNIQHLLAVNDDLCVILAGNIHIVRFQYVLRRGTLVNVHHSKKEIPFQGGALSCASLTENGAYLAAGTVNGYIFLWDLELLRIVKEFTTNNCSIIGLDTYTTHDSITLLLSGSEDSTVKCWHIASEHLSQHRDASNGGISSIRRSTSGLMSAQQAQQRQMFSCCWLRQNSDTSSDYHDEDDGTITAKVAVLDEDSNAIQIYNVSQYKTNNLLCSVDLQPRESIDRTDDDIDNCSIKLFEVDDNALYYVLRNSTVRRYQFHENSDELLWHCNADRFHGRLIVSIKCLGDNSVLIVCNRNSLTLIQCHELKPPTVTVLLNPSTDVNDNVRIFHLRQVFSLTVRIIRLLLANRSDVYVLCTKSTGAQSSSNENAYSAIWVNSEYRLESIQDGDYHINDCIMSSTESHLVLFFSNGQCDILRLKPVDEHLSYVSEYIFQLDPDEKITASAISFDGQLLALGKDNGHVEIIDVTRKTTKIILERHTLPIESLLFSPQPNYVLVSAADSLCWWKLQMAANTFESNSNEILRRSSSYIVWDTKEPQTTHVSQSTQVNKYLLAHIPLSGPLKYVTASKDFTSFITLDSLGVLHNFKVIPSRTH